LGTCPGKAVLSTSSGDLDVIDGYRRFIADQAGARGMLEGDSFLGENVVGHHTGELFDENDGGKVHRNVPSKAK